MEGDSFVGCKFYAVWNGCARRQKSVANGRTILGWKNPMSDVGCCGGVTVDPLKTLDKMPLSKIGLNYHCTVHIVELERLLRRPSCSVISRIDIFAVLSTLLSRLIEFFDIKWMRSTHHF